MKSFFPFITLFVFLLVTNTINARKDAGEYRLRGVMKDQPLPEAARSSFTSNKVTKTNCHSTENSELKRVKNFVKDFEQHDATIYHNNIKPGQGKSFSKDFARPGISVYKNDAIRKEEKSFVKDFEPRPNVSVYDNDVGLKEEKPSFVDDFEPRPNVSVYND